MEAVAPLAWTWMIHAPGYVATATLTMASLVGFEPPAVLTVTAAGSVGRGPVLWRSMAMALAPASRWVLPSQEPSRPARCPSPSVEGECRPYPAEHSAWGSAIPEAWRSGLAREWLLGLLWREQSRPARYLYRLGQAACRQHPAERELARWWSMAMSSTSCSASCSALLQSPPHPMASSTATCSASCPASCLALVQSPLRP
jgi:hypothetical protein